MSEYITPDVNIPQRNVSQELDTIFNKTRQYAGPYYDLEKQYGPLYNRLAIQNAGESTLGYTDDSGAHVPGSLELGRTATAQQREQDLADVERLGGRAVEADLNANPFLRRSLTLLGDRETDSRLLTGLNDRALGGGSPILQGLNRAATEGLAGGGELTPEDIRAIVQASRSGYSDKGTLGGNNALVTEVLNRDAAKRGRLAAAQQFASGVEGLNQNENQFETGVQGLNQAQNDFIGRATQIDATALSDPYMALLGRSGGAGGGGAGAGVTPIGQYTRAFDPYNAYFQDLFSSNQSAAATEAVANAQAQANTRTSIANIAGGFIGSDIRLKENIREVGVSPSGIPIYEFEYRAGCVPQGLRPVRYQGVMADDVEGLVPGAVSVNRKGFKEVDYSMIDVEFKEAA